MCIAYVNTPVHLIHSFPFRHRFEMEQMGRKPKKVKLNEDAFPTIHALALAPTVTEQSEPVMLTLAASLLE
jgi:hypothetical protein